MIKPQMSKEEFIAHLSLIGMKPNGFAQRPYNKRWTRVCGVDVIMVDFDAPFPMTARCLVSMDGLGKKAGSYAKAWVLINDAINKQGVWEKLWDTIREGE